MLGAFGVPGGVGSLYAAGMTQQGNMASLSSNTAPNPAPNAGTLPSGEASKNRQQRPASASSAAAAASAAPRGDSSTGTCNTEQEGLMKIPCHARGMPKDHNTMVSMIKIARLSSSLRAVCAPSLSN